MSLDRVIEARATQERPTALHFQLLLSKRIFLHSNLILPLEMKDRSNNFYQALTAPLVIDCCTFFVNLFSFRNYQTFVSPSFSLFYLIAPFGALAAFSSRIKKTLHLIFPYFRFAFFNK